MMTTPPEPQPASDPFGCVGSTIRLASGSYLDLLAPDPDAITLDDIALGLSQICRFGGQCPRFYSVAEHSVACAQYARTLNFPPHAVFACLMHDAAEAFVGDVVKPLKNLIAPLYGPIEERIEAAIAARCGVDLKSTAAQWKFIDRTLLIAERRALFGEDGVKWAGEDDVPRIEYVPQCHHPEAAAYWFKHWYRRTCGLVNIA